MKETQKSQRHSGDGETDREGKQISGEGGDAATRTEKSLAPPPRVPGAAQWGSRSPSGAGGPRRAPSRAGRSLGKARRPYSDLLGCPPQLYNLLPQPGGRGRRTDPTDRQTDRGQEDQGVGGRAGEAPAAMVSPRHGPTDTSLCAAKAPQGRFYGWVPGPRSPGPRPLLPKEPRSPGPQPLPHQGPWSQGPHPSPP